MDVFIGRDEGQAVFNGLANQHPIEGVFVMDWQSYLVYFYQRTATKKHKYLVSNALIYAHCL
jgi:hypothetical protein